MRAVGPALELPGIAVRALVHLDLHGPHWAAVDLHACVEQAPAARGGAKPVSRAPARDLLANAGECR